MSSHQMRPKAVVPTRADSPSYRPFSPIGGNRLEKVSATGHDANHGRRWQQSGTTLQSISGVLPTALGASGLCDPSDLPSDRRSSILCARFVLRSAPAFYRLNCSSPGPKHFPHFSTESIFGRAGRATFSVVWGHSEDSGRTVGRV